MNRFFNNVIDLFSGSKAKASDIEAHFSLITTGFETVQTEMDAKLGKAGGVMTGALDMGSQKIIALATPTNAGDAVNLNYVTTLFGDTATATTQAGIATTQAGIATTKAGEANTSAAAAAASIASIAGGPVASVNGMTGVVTGVATLAGVQSLTNKTITDIVFALTGTTPAFTATNGAVQTWTLTAASTPTNALTSGQSIILVITPGANTITWPSVTWTKQGGSGAAPTLFSAGKTSVVLWMVGAVLYGSHLGDTV